MALSFVFQPQAPQGLTEVHSEALRSQTLKQFRRCRQVPAGPELPQRARDGFTRPLGTEATQRSLWAHRLTPRLSTSSLPSWLKLQLPPEAPRPGPPHPDSSPVVCFCSSSCSPYDNTNKSCGIFLTCSALPHTAGQCSTELGMSPRGLGPHPTHFHSPGCKRVGWYLPL